MYKIVAGHARNKILSRENVRNTFNPKEKKHRKTYINTYFLCRDG